MSSKMGLDAMSGMLSVMLGSSVADYRWGKDGAMWFKLTHPASDRLRDTLKSFLKHYNTEYKTSFSSAHPNPYRLTLREHRRSTTGTGAPSATDRAKPRSPRR